MRVQLTSGMKIDQAKKYIADKLGVTAIELADCSVMREIRQDLDIGYPMPDPGSAKGIAAKMRIADLLGIKINSVEHFKKRSGLK